ncbi:MAG: tetratricopeptide repeat protein [bacterium]|nr:tetratricopeptide repeat protein [bacterium]
MISKDSSGFGKWQTAISWVLLVAAALLAACTTHEADRDPVSVDLPDGSAYAIPAFEFDRPAVRQAAGLDRKWQEAGAAYQAGDYRGSEQLFGEIRKTEDRDPNRHDATLYQGISLLMQGREDEAQDVLTQAKGLAEESGLPGTVDSFYIGLTAIARDDADAATDALAGALGGPFDDEAQELLASLERR